MIEIPQNSRGLSEADQHERINIPLYKKGE
jgi:hypothetical protein